MPASTANLQQRVSARAQQQTGEVATQSDRPRTIFELINAQKAEIARALPKHMDADRLARVVMTTIRQTPKLGECTPESLLAALMLCAQTGLEPGPLGHAYFVPFRNNRSGQMEVQWILGYKGIIDLAGRSGRLASIEAREVCERDTFDFEYGLNPRLEHRPFLAGDRGPIVAFYGIARFADGGYYFTVMSRSDVEDHRKRSRSKDNGPWVTDYAAMGRKTVIRSMAPYLPLTVEAGNVIAHDGTVLSGIDAVAEGAPVYIDADPTEPPARVNTTTGEITPPGDLCPVCGSPENAPHDSEVHVRFDLEAEGQQP